MITVLKRHYLGLRRLLETILYGGNLRESFLVSMLGALHRSQFRREWKLFSKEPPHFFNQRWNGFEFTYGKTRSPYGFFRGFFACEVIQTDDNLLDIGCGDGFFANTFFSCRCRHIDAIDIETSAIETARRINDNPKITFHVLDAVRDPFPGNQYDVIVWDGAIGHFAGSDLSTVLEKIAKCLAPNGIFVGSESLGTEGSDHLVFFDDEAALASVLKPYFKNVSLRTMEYNIRDGFRRKEAYWRCAQELNSRHDSTKWNEFT